MWEKEERVPKKIPKMDKGDNRSLRNQESKGTESSGWVALYLFLGSGRWEGSREGEGMNGSGSRLVGEYTKVPCTIT